MTHEAAFMAEILAAPDDDAPRLLFADWLDENGQPERAEFVRVQVALARMEQEKTDRFNEDVDWSECTGLAASWCPNCGDCCCLNRAASMSDAACPLHNTKSLHCCLDDIECRSDALRRRERELLAANEGRWLDWLKAAWGAEWVPVRECSVVWRRGFAEIVTLTAADWLAHADALTAAAPIREVRLTTWPEFATRSAPSMKNQGRLHGRREWFVLETNLVGRLTSQVALELLRAEWPRINFTLPPSLATADWNTEPGDIMENLRAVWDQFIRDA